MKKILSLIILGLIIPMTQTFSQNIKVETDHNFGNVLEGTMVSYEFNLKNLSSEKILIKNVQPSCGCVSPHFTKEILSPGKTGLIKATFNSKGRLGVFEKTLRVYLYPGDSMVLLTIRGNVLGSTDYVQNQKVDTVITNFLKPVSDTSVKSTERIYYRGPRGGLYYYNSKGKKVYK